MTVTTTPRPRPASTLPRRPDTARRAHSGRRSRPPAAGLAHRGRGVRLVAVAALALLTPTGAAAEPAPGDPPSAWRELQAGRSEALRGTSEAERRILRQITLEQARAWAAGADPGRVELGDGRTLADLLDRGSGGALTLSRSAILSAAGPLSGGGFTLFVTAGEPISGTEPVTGGGFSVGGGFGDVPDLLLFRDGFESGATGAWSGGSGRRREAAARPAIASPPP